MTNHASREMVFQHDQRQLEEQKRARNHTPDIEELATWRKKVSTGVIDLGPVTIHEPLDPQLRPNPPVPVNPQANGHSANGWNPHH